jgi:DNA-binding transcriptional MocR family regulator
LDSQPSKVLFPALRLGYVVVPDDMIDAFMGGGSVQS